MNRERALSFGAVAEAYDYGRPGYPADVVRACVDGARRVLDLGAGTGKLSRALLALGLEVVAVEPDAQMRALIPAEAQALDGAGEAIPLPDGAVDAVLVGQAFHWFERERAEAEMRRVTRPGGTIAALWNTFDDRVDWVGRIADLLQLEDRFSLLEDSPVFVGERRVMVDWAEDFDADRLVANVASRSVVSLRPPAERDALLDQVRGLAPPGTFALPHVCDAHIVRV